MARIYSAPPSGEGNGHEQKSRAERAEWVERHPWASVFDIERSEAAVLPGQAWSRVAVVTFAGGLAGLIFGALLHRRVLIVPKWEGLFSMGDVSFHAFWMLAGIVSSILLIGIDALLGNARAPRPSEVPVRVREEIQHRKRKSA